MITDADIQRIREKADLLVNEARFFRCRFEAWRDILILQVEAEDLDEDRA